VGAVLGRWALARGPRSLGEIVASVLLVIMLLTACTSDAQEQQADDPDPGTTVAGDPTPEPGDPIELDVLAYNVEYGGDETTDAVIAEIDADIVGVLESYDRLPEMAEITEYPYHNVSLQLLSKFPIHEPSGAEGRYALVEVRPGYVVAVFNHHLDFVKFGMRLLRRGLSVDEVVASEERIRSSALEVSRQHMRNLIDRGYPVVFTGDHNTPSSLDFGEETVGSRPGIDEPIPWPVSEGLFEVGLRDTYRDIHPDPLETPGVTHPRRGERIDYIYAGGPSETLDSQLVGKEGDPDVQIGFDTWTSDHLAILSSLRVTPVSMPVMVSVDRALLDQGDPLTVAYRAPEPTGTVALVPEGDASPAVRQELSDHAGRFDVDTSTLESGGYDAVLHGADGSEIASVGLWIRDTDAQIQLTTDRSVYEIDQPIVVNWTDGPATRWDWIGIYDAEAADTEVDYYLLWTYTDLHESGTVPPSTSGSVSMDDDAVGPWPLEPGEYVVHYLAMDQYVSVGSAPFEVTG
jgi:hypothetical protein